MSAETSRSAAAAAADSTPNAEHTLSLSLVSHTNVGKTTLARTLLGRDVGEVRDAAHVTEAAEAQCLVRTDAGERLLLWDTPGFGDSQRLARRLAQAGKPLGWFLSEVWDRWRDRPFWASQRVLKHVLAECELVLYLVNSAEAPEDAGYLDAELQVLALLKRPVVALLNQLGEATGSESAAAADALAARWTARLHAAPVVRAVLPLDAFTRCWVQEGVLWQQVAPLLPAPRQPLFERLRAAWLARQMAQWQAAMAELAQRLTHAALDRQRLPDDGWRAPLKSLGARLGKALGWERDGLRPPAEAAMAVLAERLDAELRRSTDALIALHGLDGHAGREVTEKLARHYALRQPIDEGKAALWGGLVTGALAGLKADLATGGLTLGGGLLAGGVIGALSAAGAVHGVNWLRGVDAGSVAWDTRVLDALLANALLAYLAVAHHGRGRGAWVAQEPPPEWTTAVADVLAERRDAVDMLWQQRQGLLEQGEAAVDSAAALHAPLQEVLEDACAALLARLYPQASAVLPAPFCSPLTLAA